MMKIIVAQKYRHLSRLIVIALSAIVLSGSALSVNGAEVRSANKTFADWCRQKADLSPEAKHTVEVLLQKAWTTDCDEGDRQLSSLTQLSLVGEQISDIKPLASLTELTLLQLNFNKIVDIKPLASLTELSWLDLSNNQIGDIKPLTSLTELSLLYLGDNRISDIKPLTFLTELRNLHLSDNQIADIKPLDISENSQSLCVVKL